ncbi:hypothetical protein Tco_0232966 [Tanacetum coccineum]
MLIRSKRRNIFRSSDYEARHKGRPLQEKALPFMKTLKSYTSGKMVQWTTEANEAFRRMKECLESLPTMVIPTKGETLTVYLTGSKKRKCSINGRKGEETGFCIFCKSDTTRSITKVPRVGKAHTCPRVRRKEAPKIFPSTPNTSS